MSGVVIVYITLLRLQIITAHNCPTGFAPMDKNTVNSSHVEDTASGASSPTIWQSVRHNSKVVLFCIGPCIGSMLWGFDIGS